MKFNGDTHPVSVLLDTFWADVATALALLEAYVNVTERRQPGCPTAAALMGLGGEIR